MSEINIEDLTPGTVVQLKPAVVTEVFLDRVHCAVGDDTYPYSFDDEHIARIISRPETDADKIARLERGIAERDARIAELDTIAIRAPGVTVGDVLDAGVPKPTTPVWSDPIEGPPNPSLPVGSFSVYGGPDDRGDVWLLSLTADDPYSRQAKQHRILMQQPIQWEGGERPVPADWQIDVPWPSGQPCEATAQCFDWSKPFTFTLTSTGGK